MGFEHGSVHMYTKPKYGWTFSHSVSGDNTDCETMGAYASQPKIDHAEVNGEDIRRANCFKIQMAIILVAMFLKLGNKKKLVSKKL